MERSTSAVPSARPEAAGGDFKFFVWCCDVLGVGVSVGVGGLVAMVVGNDWLVVNTPPTPSQSGFKVEVLFVNEPPFFKGQDFKVNELGVGGGR